MLFFLYCGVEAYRDANYSGLENLDALVVMFFFFSDKMRGMDESQKFGNSAKGVLFGMVRAFQSKVENVTSGPIGTSSWKPRLGHHMEFAQPAG